jgi:hypothetical protein
MKQIFQVGRFATYFLVGLFTCYSIITATGHFEAVFHNALAAFLGALVVGLLGGLVAIFRSRPSIDSSWSWRSGAGFSWLAGGLLGGVLLSFLLTTPLMPPTPNGDSRMVRIIQKIILVCLPNDEGCRRGQYYGTEVLVVLIPLLIGALGAIAGGELARRRYVGKGRSGIRSAD